MTEGILLIQPGYKVQYCGKQATCRAMDGDGGIRGTDADLPFVNYVLKLKFRLIVLQ
jgi:hypothetical protein